MSKLIKLFLPLALIAFGLKASQKEDAQKINIDWAVRRYLEVKCEILKSNKAFYLCDKIQKCLNDSKPAIISDTIEHAQTIAAGMSDLRELLYESVVGDQTENGMKNYVGHLGQISSNLDGIPLFDKYIVSKNEKYFLTRCDDGTARVWNKEWGTSRILIGHTHAVTAIDFSPDSKAVLTGGYDAKVIYWNLENHKIITNNAHRTLIVKVKFIGNTTFQSTSADGVKKIWRIEDGDLVLVQDSSDKSSEYLASKSRKNEANIASSRALSIVSREKSDTADGNVKSFELLNCDIAAPDFNEIKKATQELAKDCLNKLQQEIARLDQRCKELLQAPELINLRISIQEDLRDRKAERDRQAQSLEDQLAFFALAPDSSCKNLEDYRQEIRDIEQEIQALENGERKNLLLARIAMIKKTWYVE